MTLPARDVAANPRAMPAHFGCRDPSTIPPDTAHIYRFMVATT
jgi:hypothetical protein